MIEVTGSKLWLINFYREQLGKFAKLGLGGITEHEVKVTAVLIEATKRRLRELTVVYDSSMTSQALKLRKLKKRKGRLNVKTNGNGAVTTSLRKGNSNTGHERDGS